MPNSDPRDRFVYPIQKLMIVSYNIEPENGSDHGFTGRSVSWHSYMSLFVKKPAFGFSPRSYTNQAVQSQKMARGLKIKNLFYLDFEKPRC